jgi:hypothetical protein
MKFLSIWTPDAKTASRPPSNAYMAEMGRLIDEGMKAGTLLATGGLLPVTQGGARVRSFKGKITVIDGPFTESKELVAGFAILQANSKDEAIEGVKRFLKVAGDGESELRQIMQPAEERAR